MLVECSHCGAPLDVSTSAGVVRCSYCTHHNRVRSMRTISAQAPLGWAPPPSWVPPNARAPLPYRAPPAETSIRTVAILIVVLVLVTTLCPLLFVPLLFLR